MEFLGSIQLYLKTRLTKYQIKMVPLKINMLTASTTNFSPASKSLKSEKFHTRTSLK